MKRQYRDPDTGATVVTEPDVTGEEGTFWLTKVECPSTMTGTGGASRCMRAVVRDADHGGIRLKLFILPKPDSPVRRRELREWYCSFGFTHRGNDHMVRIPNAPE
jgi:hypothetical protein